MDVAIRGVDATDRCPATRIRWQIRTGRRTEPRPDAALVAFCDIGRPVGSHIGRRVVAQRRRPQLADVADPSPAG